VLLEDTTGKDHLAQIVSEEAGLADIAQFPD
jgi:hypothetical protein